MTLAAADAEEAALLAAIAPGRAATLEDVLSGDGVGALYAALSGEAMMEARAVFARRGTDPAARRTALALSRWLGRAAGDLVLATRHGAGRICSAASSAAGPRIAMHRRSAPLSRTRARCARAWAGFSPAS